ncbi:hypothetical protein FNH22_21060 [Fulvivirga sp. M361]|uniref:hypothetical protein n=1 Tax=Fulvivirga sp. M361 TaxID=2594266 RepID=UPI00117BAE77|nr:hypothetical protein [Fulvivirga sp. M361]TRX53387.1 hypothetical protein FNH22_21060 [Fulvivirga sp. M361]
MKQLKKLNLNEMQDFQTISNHEQMLLKGGAGGPNPYLVEILKVLASKVTESLFGCGEEPPADANGNMCYEENGMKLEVTQTGIVNNLTYNAGNGGDSCDDSCNLNEMLMNASDSVKMNSDGSYMFYLGN